jgi:AcrR family transcriptional regulator
MPEDKKQYVLSFALQRFMAVGYSNVSMDDISRGCGISKATLYKWFPSKESLILACVDSISDVIGTKMSAIMSDPSLSLMEMLYSFFAPIAALLARVNPAALDDIRRCVPLVYEKIDQTRRRLILRNIGMLLSEGKKAGFVRPDVNEAIVAHIIIGTASHIVNPDILMEFGQTPDRILDTVKNVIIRGCLTENGLKLWNDIQ